jgi:hypothetical protein
VVSRVYLSVKEMAYLPSPFSLSVDSLLTVDFFLFVSAGKSLGVEHT